MTEEIQYDKCPKCNKTTRELGQILCTACYEQFAGEDTPLTIREWGDLASKESPCACKPKGDPKEAIRLLDIEIESLHGNLKDINDIVLLASANEVITRYIIAKARIIAEFGTGE